MGRWLVFLFLLLGSLLPAQSPLVGVKMYQVPGNWDATFAAWKRLGITAVWAGPEVQRERAFREGCKAQGLKRYLIFPVFFNPEVLKAHPDWVALDQQGRRAVDDWVEFVCPSRTAYLDLRSGELSALLREVEPDGLSLDFLRHFVFWEMVYPDRSAASLPRTCLCDTCWARFRRETGLQDGADLKSPQARWAFLERGAFAAWTRWRRSVIEGIAKDLATRGRREKAGLEVCLHAVPWRLSDFGGAALNVAGQDLGALGAQVDLVSPMVYHHMVKRPTGWIHDVVKEMAGRTDRPILPSIQVAEAYLKTPLDVRTFRRALDQALMAPSRGVVFWNWEALAKDPAKQRVVQRRCGGLH